VADAVSEYEPYVAGTFALERRAADAGRSPDEQRRFESGYQEAKNRIKEIMSQPPPAASAAPSPEYLMPDQFRQLPRGENGRWWRETPAGKLAAVVAPPEPDEDARLAQEARDLADTYEFTYGRRPSVNECKWAVRWCSGRRSNAVTVSGTAAEIGQVFQRAGLGLEVVTAHKPLPADPVNVIFKPVAPG
jgi:hypothetical protein